jgi:hypothetical protein
MSGVLPHCHVATRHARAIGRSLLPAGAMHVAAGYGPSMVAGLPEAARRWLTYAIAPGTLLIDAVEIRMHGEIRLGRWRAFTATQALVPGAGYVWAARTRIGGIPVRGYDCYAKGRGEMRWRALGIVPVGSAVGADVTRSAAGRLAAESVLVPPYLIGAEWSPGVDRDTAVFRPPGCRSEGNDVTIAVTPDGRLRRISMQRWGNPDGGAFAAHTFEVIFDATHRIGGIAIPDGIRAAWVDDDGRRQEFFRAVVDRATFLPRHGRDIPPGLGP